MGTKEYYKDYEIHYYEIDYRKKLLFTSLMDYLGDIANSQSRELGVGIDFLRERKLGWVLYSWNIRIDKYPSFGDIIKIKTVPTGFRKFYAFRTYEVMDSAGNVIGSAESVWFLIDTDRRRPVRIMEEMYGAYGIDMDSSENSEIFKLEKPLGTDEERSFHVRYSDIDTNNHVNNVKYVSWAVEAVPIDIITEYSIKSLKINYIKETQYGDTVKSSVQIDKKDGEFISQHKITDEEGNELALLQTVWQEISD